jgi:hypothetical protein
MGKWLYFISKQFEISIAVGGKRGSGPFRKAVKACLFLDWKLCILKYGSFMANGCVGKLPPNSRRCFTPLLFESPNDDLDLDGPG